MKSNKLSCKSQIAVWMISLSIGVSGSSFAAITDLSNVPLATSSSTSVEPNIMFMLDDSGSMDWDYMPDDALNFKGKFGFNSSQCNGVYYNPSISYSAPIKSDGTFYPNSSFTAAPRNGYSTGSGTVNLSTSFTSGSGTGQSGYVTGGVPAFYYKYSGTQTASFQQYYHTLTTSLPAPNGSYSIFYNECNSTSSTTTKYDGTNAANSVFTKVIVSATSGPGGTDERTNFANWYSYYSTRKMMMLTGVGLAFAPVPSTYRIAFMTMNNNVSPDFVDIDNFAEAPTAANPSCTPGTNCQKDLWYAKLYATAAGNSTPLREALSHVGQYYAHKFGSVTTYTSTITVGCTGSCNALVTNVQVAAGVNNALPTAPLGETMNCALTNITPNTTCAVEDVTLGVTNTSTSSVAGFINNQINAMQATDYGSTVAGNVVTITGVKAALGLSPVVIATQSGFANMTFTVTPFVATTASAGTLNGILPVDPMQYSCQQNFVILSTDGYWNGSTTYNLTNGTVGNQDGSEVRPMYDGASTVTTTTTPIITSQEQQTVTTGAVVTKTWSDTNTVIGGACTTSSVPAGATSAPMTDGTHSIGLGSTITSTNPYPGRCVAVGTQIPGNYPWLCRGSGGGGTPVENNPSVTDGAGVTWYLVSSGSNLNAATCTTDFASFGYSKTEGACPGAGGGPGKSVTVTPYTQTETLTGAVLTVLSNYSASQTQTVVTTNGVAAPPTYSPSTPVYTFVNTVSTTNTAPTSDTCGGASPCGVAGSAGWVAGTPNPNNVCTALASVPTAGYSAVTLTSTVTTGGTSATTVAAQGSPIAGTPTSTVVSSGGTSNTLADVAEYYYKNDLRDNSLGNCTGSMGVDVCANNVPFVSSDANQPSWQHMTTFTLGLGARGMMNFTPDYGGLSATTTATLTACSPTNNVADINGQYSGDFCAVLTGATANGTTVCNWQSSGVCNWPIPASSAIQNIDDLWHASLDGRGAYYSATNPQTLASGLNNALASINQITGAAAASTPSNPTVTSANNADYISNYVSSLWFGDLQSAAIDLVTGNVCTLAMNAASLCTTGWTLGTSVTFWDADLQLANLIPTADANNPLNLTTTASPANYGPNAITSRNIWMFNSVASNGLAAFTAANAPASYFTNKCYAGSVAIMSQCTTSNLNTTQQGQGNTAAYLIDWLRGDEWLAPTIYRSRHVAANVGANGPNYYFLGDTVDTQPAYVGAPTYNFLDTGYATWATVTEVGRAGVVYIGANDGMLHAFDSSSGKENWAYVPTMVMPNLYKLADANYYQNHQYYVDGYISTMDVYNGTAWSTILVGGLGAGGQGYYALDITDPLNPKGLWEICSSSTLCPTNNDSNMGDSFGNPVITKRSNDGRWVVLVSSGYNNTGGTGQGTLYELDAFTGTILRQVSTGVGSTTSPSGLSKLSPWFDNLSANMTARYVYAGDLQGNVWRFDLGAPGSSGTAGITVQNIAVLDDPSGVAQSVTARIELGDPLADTPNSLGGIGNPVLYVATGRYLGLSDLSAPEGTQVQTIYAIKDNLASPTTWTSPRTYTSFVQQFLYQPSATTRTVSSNSVNFASNSGWYVDLLVYNSSTGVAGSASGERVNVDPILVNGALLVASNVPSSSACSLGGTSWEYSFNWKSGSSIGASVGQLLQTPGGTSETAGISVVKLPDGTIKEIVTSTSGANVTYSPPISSSGATKLTSWRELTQ